MQRISVRISVVKSMPPPQTPTADGSVRLHRVWPGWFGTDVKNTIQQQACVKRPHHMAVCSSSSLLFWSLSVSIASVMGWRSRIGTTSTRTPTGTSSSSSSGLGVTVRRTVVGAPSSQALIGTPHAVHLQVLGALGSPASNGTNPRLASPSAVFGWPQVRIDDCNSSGVESTSTPA